MLIGPQALGESPYFVASVASLAAMMVLTSLPASIVAITLAFASTAYLLLNPNGSLPAASVADWIRVTVVWAMCAAAATMMVKLRERQRHLQERLDEPRLGEQRTHALPEDASDAAVRAERDLLDGIIETSPSGILAIDVQTQRIVFANQRIIDAMGVTRGELYSTSLEKRTWETTDLAGRKLDIHELPAYLVATTGNPVLGMRVRFVMSNGTELLTSLNATALKDESGRPKIIVETLEDITQQVATQRALAETESRMEMIAKTFPGVIFQFRLESDQEMSFTYMSDGVHDLLGVNAADSTGALGKLWEFVLPEYHATLLQSIHDAALSLQPWSQDFRVRDVTGRVKWIRGTSYPVTYGEEAHHLWNGVLLDVTQLKEMEQNLLQAQKMEGIGRLAGGIAHDFNNILTAIRGNVDLLLEDIPPEDERAAEVGEIRDAATRASTLTRQLLAFSRKQLMQPRDLDLNVLVRDVEKMLRRVIGEDIALLTVPGDSLGMIRADPGQLEQTLLNLAINARDAMPDGGLLTIDTRNARLDAAQAAALGVTPGDYVALVVRDTGHGMSADVRAHIFEPFFTTKPPGKGTGLGLAMVYGIVQQSGGAIVVESEAGRGATFRLYFPLVVSRERPSPTSVSAIQPAPAHGPRATLLLVEDDTAVRQLTRRLLERRGYTVHTASDAYQALTMIEQKLDEIDLVVSDVIMPGIGGRDLMTELRRRRPELRVLFISGYLDIDATRLGLDRRTRLLLKPFTQDALLSIVQQMLEDAPQRDGPAPAPIEPLSASVDPSASR